MFHACVMEREWKNLKFWGNLNKALHEFHPTFSMPVKCNPMSTNGTEKPFRKGPEKQQLRLLSPPCQKHIDEINSSFVFYLQISVIWIWTSNFELCSRKANLIQGQLAHGSSWPSLRAHFYFKTSVESLWLQFVEYYRLSTFCWPNAKSR